jgi:hypothetical protein
VNGERVNLVLATGLRNPLLLASDYATERDLVLPQIGAWGSAVTGQPQSETTFSEEIQLTTLGRTIVFQHCATRDLALRISPGVLPLAGMLGMEFLSCGSLGIDIPNRKVGFSLIDRNPRAFSHRLEQLSLIDLGQRQVSITRDLKDLYTKTSDEHPVCLINTGSPISSVAYDYLDKRASWLGRFLGRRALRDSNAVIWRLFETPWESWLKEPVRVQSSYRPTAKSLGLERIDMILGLRFLERWVCVFRFPAGELHLFPHR